MKTPTLLITGLTALSLSACGATTGGIAKSMAKQTAVSSVTSKVTPTAAPAAVQAPIIDGTMDCAALTTEMAEVDATIMAANKILGNSGSANLAGQVAATGASQAALHSGAAGALAKVPFGGLFAKSAMDVVANSGKRKAEQAQADLQNANLRKASLTGLYAGKNCAP